MTSESFLNFLLGGPMATTPLSSNDTFYVSQGGVSKQAPFSAVTSGGIGPNGTIVAGWSSISFGSFINIQPGSGLLWGLQSFQGEAEFEVYKTDGVNSKLIIPAGMANTPALLEFNLVATNGIFYQLKNVNTSPKFLGFSGRIYNAAANAWTSTASGAFLNVQPATGVEWAILSLHGEAEFEVWRTDGINAKLVIPAGVPNTPAVVLPLSLSVNNGLYYQLKNVNSATKYLGYDIQIIP